MPRYLNSGSDVVDAEGIRLEVGEPKDTYQWIGTLPTGVTKVADAPYLDPVISSAAYTTSQTITVPVTVLGNYQITIYAATGELSVKFNSASAVAYILPEGAMLVKTCLSRTINDIRLVVAVAGNAYVLIEKI